MTPEIFIPETHETKKGREFAHRLIHSCADLADSGKTPDAIYLSEYANHCMGEFFAVNGQPMPKDLAGIPIHVGSTAGREIVIRLADKDVEF